MRRRLRRMIGYAPALGLLLIWGCPVRPPPSNENTNEGGENVNENAGGGVAAIIPAKSISFDLVAIHDPNSDAYNNNCIGCHGERTDEVALDGVTPAAHATMLAQFGSGNDRCIACHDGGPDFLTWSRGGLRKQVDIEAVGCAVCHGASATPSFYQR